MGRLAIFNFAQLWTIYFAQLPTELRTTALQLTFTPFFYFHTKPHLLIRIVCMREAQTLRMCIPSNNCSEDDISLAVEDQLQYQVAVITQGNTDLASFPGHLLLHFLDRISDL